MVNVSIFDYLFHACCWVCWWSYLMLLLFNGLSLMFNKIKPPNIEIIILLSIVNVQSCNIITSSNTTSMTLHKGHKLKDCQFWLDTLEFFEKLKLCFQAFFSHQFPTRVSQLVDFVAFLNVWFHPVISEEIQ